MDIKMPRQWLHSLADIYLPTIISNQQAFQRVYDTGSKEYFTCHVIVSVCREVEALLRKKMATTTGYEPKVKLTAAQAYSMYLSFKTFPIAQHLLWDNMMRNRFIREVDKFIANPEAAIKYDMTKG